MKIFPPDIPVSKRLFDLLVTSLGLILATPILLILAIWVFLSLGNPIIFRQKRPGYRGQPFTIYKLRTMTDARDAGGKLLPDNFRITRLGRFLRSSSLDELPELINVLRGEMSLVGPRPLLMQYLDRYTLRQVRRHDTLPGITGWAQINGRNTLTWEQKFDLDIWYVDNWSFLLDLKILWLTIFKVVRREDVNQSGFSSAEEFMGTSSTRNENKGPFDE